MQQYKDSKTNPEQKRKNLKIFFTVIALFFLFMLIAKVTLSYVNKDKPRIYNYSASVPFDLTMKGNKVEVFLNAQTDSVYNSELHFYYYDPRDVSHEKIFKQYNNHIELNYFTSLVLLIAELPFDYIKEKFRKELTQEELQAISKDRERVKQLMDYDYTEKDESGVGYYRHTGVPTPIHLTILEIRKDGTEKIIFNQSIENVESPKDKICLQDFCRVINSIKLTKGTYKFVAETLKDSPEFIGTTVHLQIFRPGGSK